MNKTTSLLGQILVLSSLLQPIYLQAADHPAVPSYNEALNQMQSRQRSSDKSKFTPAERIVMDRAADDLAKRMPDPGIKPGEKAPDFSLPNAFGKSVRLSELLKDGPVVLVFYRGAWCPYCNLHLRVLQESLPKFEYYGAQLITVTPQKPDQSAAQIRKNGYPFEVLSDLDSRVMQAYRLYFEVDPELVAVYKKHGLDLSEYNGEGRQVLPVPGTFVIDTQGIVRAMYADTDYKQRMEPAAIIAAMQKITGRP